MGDINAMLAEADRMDDLKAELRHIGPGQPQMVVDAGCGYGVATRYLASRFQSATVLGIDASAAAVATARRYCRDHQNVLIEQGYLEALELASGSADLLLCRYVLGELGSAAQRATLGHFFRVLKPGARIHLVDHDGYLDQLYPITPLISHSALMIKTVGMSNAGLGRRLPSMLEEAGFTDIRWDIDAMNLTGAAKFDAIERYLAPLTNRAVTFDEVINMRGATARLRRDLLDCMNKPSSVFYCNRFVVSATRPEA